MSTQNIFSLIKQLKDIAGFTRDEFIAIWGKTCNEKDFEHGNYRFIHKDHIDGIMVEEMEADPYALGCFSASAIADVTGIDQEAIQMMQGAEAFEGIGQMLIRGGTSIGRWVELLQDYYQRFDGYGHHFAHYDGEEHQVGNWYVFRIN